MRRCSNPSLCALQARIADAARTLNVLHIGKRSSARWFNCEPSAVFKAATPRRPPDDTSRTAKRSSTRAVPRESADHDVQVAVVETDAAARSKPRRVSEYVIWCD